MRSVVGLPIPWWVAVLVLAVGGLFVAMGTRALHSARRRQRTWTSVTGQVVGSRLDGDGHLRFQAEYLDTAGRPVRFWNRHTASGGPDRTGQQVQILVNPGDPTDAVISSGAATGQLVGVVFLVFGVIAEVAGVVLVVSALG